MIRLTAFAAAALLGCSSLASAQYLGTNSYRTGPSYDRSSGSTMPNSSIDRYSGSTNSSADRYSGSTMPSDRYSNRLPNTDRYGAPPEPMRQTERRTARVPETQFTSEADARSHCRSDAVVWMNARSHVYHLAGTPKYGNTKHGAFMCRADADNAGHLAKNERAAAQR